MTTLPKEAIEEFKVLYKKEYGLELSDEEASRQANKLVDLYKAVYRKRNDTPSGV